MRQREMLVGPLRRCRKLWPYLVFVVSIFFVILWRRAQLAEDKKIHLKHFYKGNQEEYVDKRGIHVVVGHYVGHGSKKVPNATNDMINTNNFNPRPEAGKNGNPVVIEPKDFIKMQQLFQINRFNLLASDRIPLNRSLPDMRRKKCTTLYKDLSGYPKSSIIIVFHNEAWSTLLRTVWSVINRSPKELVEEIILVDDASDREFLRKPLDDYIKTLPTKTTLIRSPERIGLVKARLLGAQKSTGQILTFLDAHCECTKGWLEGLISEIKKDSKTVVCPVIDIINDDTFAYVKSFELHWGAFNWNLQFRWFTLGGVELKKRKKDNTQAFNTPAMAGGLFAIDRNYFYELGSYDEDMSIWGGENLEMSFRIWQCGGKIVIAPCSHVGHLFRKSSPYTFPGGISKTLYSNLARVALVWMDEWGEFYFKFNEDARKMKESLNVTTRMALRRKLQCKTFEWYLDNVWPQHFFPKNDRFFGRIRNLGENKCLIKPDRKMNSNQPMGVAKLEQCIKDKNIPVEMFVMTPNGFIMTDDSICLDAPEKVLLGPSKVRIMACSGYNRQKWFYNDKSKELVHVTNKQCLDVSQEKTFTEGLVIVNCTGSKSQKWVLEPIPWN